MPLIFVYFYIHVTYISYIDVDAPDDADPGPQDLLLWPRYTNTHTHGLQKSWGGKGMA